MKHSEILRKAAKARDSFLCNEVKRVSIRHKIPKLIINEIEERIQKYIGEGNTFNMYLEYSVQCPIAPRTPEQEQFVRFLRYKMAIFLAEQYELEGK